MGRLVYMVDLVMVTLVQHEGRLRQLVRVEEVQLVRRRLAPAERDVASPLVLSVSFGRIVLREGQFLLVEVVVV